MVAHILLGVARIEIILSCLGARGAGESNNVGRISLATIRGLELDNMANIVPLSTPGNMLLGFGILGKGVSMALVALGRLDRKL